MVVKEDTSCSSYTVCKDEGALKNSKSFSAVSNGFMRQETLLKEREKTDEPHIL